MKTHIRFKIIRIVDVDPFSTGLPYVRLTAAEEAKTSAEAARGKDPARYEYNSEDKQNSIEFPIVSETFQCSVAVLSKDESAQISQYPGIGKIKLFIDETNKQNVEQTCPLYEDGDEMLEIGALIYLYECFEAKVGDVAADGVAAVDADPADEDLYGANSLQLSPRIEDFNTSSLKLTPRDVDTLKKHPEKEGLLVAQTAAEPVAPTDEDMAEYLLDGASEGGFALDSIGSAEELIVAPVLHIHPEHMHLATLNSTAQYTMQPQHAQSNRSISSDWARTAEDSSSSFVSDLVRSDLDRASSLCKKVVVRLHSLICSAERTLDASFASAKLSLQPLPGRVISLRSVTDRGNASPAAESRAAADGTESTSTIYSFGLKTAQLSMGPGDLRSRGFREGACPRLCVEVALGGAESYTGFVELYLPALLAECSGQMLSLPLVSPCRTDGDQSSAAITGTLLLEVNPLDLIPEGKALLPAPPSTQRSTAKTSQRSLTATQQTLPRFQAPARLDVQFGLTGICGAVLQDHPNIGQTATLEAFLTSSGRTETASLAQCTTVADSASAIRIKKMFSFESDRPNVDILQLRLRNGSFPEDELGRVSVPLWALLQRDSESSLQGTKVAFKVWKKNPEREGAYEACNLKIVGSLSYAALGASHTEGICDPALLADSSGPEHRQGDEQWGIAAASAIYSGNGRMAPSTWMHSPDRMNMNATDSSRSSSKPSAVKSTAGQLMCCVKGLFSSRGFADGTGNQEAELDSLRAYAQRGYVLTVEVTLKPEGLKKRTSPSAALALSGGDIDATVEWSKAFSTFVAFALQQRSVPVLEFTLFADKAPNTAQKQTTAGKISLASTSLDLSTLICGEDAPAAKCLLPLCRVNASPQHTTCFDQRSDLAGWLFVGLRFCAASPGMDIRADLESLDLAMQQHWRALAAFPTQYCLGVVAHSSDASSDAALRALQANPTKLSRGSLHVAISSLQLASQRTAAELFSDWRDADVTCVVKYGNDSSCSIAFGGHVQGERIVWAKTDAIMKIQRETSVSQVLYTYLVRGAQGSLSNAGDVLAEASCVLPQSQLDKGLPVNFLLPMRDHRGERCATLSFCAQLTYVGDTTVDGVGTSSLAASGRSEFSDQSAQPVPLRVEFCEGNIADSDYDEKMEPFFECSLLLPEKEELLTNPTFSTKARTGFLRVADNLEHWDLDCTVHVPAACVSSIDRATTTLLSASRSKAAFDAAQISNGVCILGIVCRDASKQGCPEIGWARIALPRQLVLQGKPVEQWITLSPPSPSASTPPPQYGYSNGGTAKHSRLRLRISVDHKDYEAAYAPFGIGAVLMRVLGVHDQRAGMNDDLVSARMSSYAWPEGVSGDPAELQDENLFSQISAHPASYINEMSIFNQDSLVGSLPVAGGFGDVKLNVKTFTTNTAYTTSFPVMATTTKCVGGGELPPIPVLTLNLSRERSADLASPAPGAARTQRVRLEPQLRVAAAFVPYVSGKLVLHCKKLEMVVQPTETVPGGAVMRSLDSPLAVRYLLGNNSARFMFSPPFQLDSERSSSTAPALGGPPSLSESDNITLMEVDTFDVIANSIRRSENMTMMPLFVSLLEQWDLLDPVVERRGQQACLGIGQVPTAVCYYQALRAAASAPMQPRTASDRSSDSSNDPVAASPWLTAIVDIFDPKTKLKVAVMSLDIQFVLGAVPEHIQRMLSGTVSRALMDPSAKARMELGLKQSFVLADVDKSGSVSSEELLEVISSNNALTVARANRSTGTTQLTGMENTTELLLQLANVSAKDINTADQEALGELVRRIFAQLDVDGDGKVSWWEWQSVLSASLLGRNPASKYMHHLDALVISTKGASEALKALNPNRPFLSATDDFHGHNSATRQAVLPYIKLRINGFDPTTMEAIVCEDGDGQFSIDTAGAPPSKTVNRLHSMVKSLRLTNSILAKRFERALSTAQNLSIDLDKEEGLQNASTSGANRQGAKLSEIEYLEQRVHTSEHQSQENLHSFLTAKERAEQLVTQLTELKTMTSVLEQSRSKPQLYTYNEELEREIQANASKLQQAQQLRKQRTAEVFGLFRLKALVSKLIMPKVRQRRKNKATRELTRVLGNYTVRRRYLAWQEERCSAALVLQAAGRSLLERKRVKEMHHCATRTQAVFRSMQARRHTHKLKQERDERARLEQERQVQLRRELAAFCITRALRAYGAHLKDLRNSAALRLQSLLKQNLQFKAAKATAQDKRNARDLRTQEEKRLAEELAALKEKERLRLEEEKQREEAAKKLTRVMSAQFGKMEGKKMHAFLAAQQQLSKVDRPALDALTGYWVSYPKSMSTAPEDAAETQSSFQHFGRGNYGSIQSIDPCTRVMDVLFLYNKLEPKKRSGAKFEVQRLPYDHPLLEFLTYVPEPEEKLPERGYMVTYAGGAQSHWVPFRPFTDRPVAIEDTVGYRVGVKDREQDPSGDEGALFPGRVVGFDRAQQTVCILFDSTDEAAVPDHEDLTWTSADIHWLMPATVSRPATIQEAVGFNVEVHRNASTAEVHRGQRGTVIGIDEVADTVRIAFAPPADQLEATETDSLDFNSPHISWINKVAPRPAPRPSGHSISKLIETTRPSNLLDAVGHLVEVRSREEDAEPGDMYSGMVVAADSMAGTVRILYDSASKHHDQEEQDDADEDFEDLPWLSPDIIWVIPDPDSDPPPGSPMRPTRLADTIGKHIDVISHENDAEEGDFFSGVVVSVDNAQQTLRVLFDGNDNGEDYEDLPWNSPDIYWLTDESVRARDARSVGESIPSARDEPKAPISERPSALAEAQDWKVKVNCNLLKGEVVDAEDATESVWIAIDSVPGASAPVQVKAHVASSLIEWVSAPTTVEPADSSTAPMVADTKVPVSEGAGSRPLSLAAAVGWAVEVRTEDGEDEVFVGEVAAVDEPSQMVKVLFAGEDGSLQEDDCEHFPFQSPLLTWLNGPASTAVVAAAQPIDSSPATKPVESRARAAVGRTVNVLLEGVCGSVTSVSQALQTLNIALAPSAAVAAPSSPTDMLLLGLPFSSCIIDWDGRS